VPLGAVAERRAHLQSERRGEFQIRGLVDTALRTHRPGVEATDKCRNDNDCRYGQLQPVIVFHAALRFHQQVSHTDAAPILRVSRTCCQTNCDDR
jgi:hypothetical protein